MIKNKFLKNRLLLISFILALIAPNLVLADGMWDDAPKHKRKAAPVQEVAQAPRVEAPLSPAVVTRREETAYEEECEWKTRLSAGVTTAFFKEENNLPMANLSFDVWRTDIPLNYRVGVEGRHMYLGQDAANFAQEFDGKTTRITYIRIPFALEYIQPLDEEVTLYLGGGPDIIHTANDISETDVGGHLGARLHYAFDNNWGISLEAGYAWLRIDGEEGGQDINLDNAYITPAVAYTF